MDVQPLASPISYRVGPSDHPLSRIAQLATVLGATLVLCLCLIVVIRGLLGAFETPGSPLLLVLGAVAAELLASVFRVVWRRLHPRASQPHALVARLAVPSLCVLCVVFALSMTGAASWAIGSLWLVFLAGEFAWWYPAMRAWRDRGAERAAAMEIGREGQAARDDDAEMGEREEIEASVIQQIIRSRNDRGVEVISGILRAEFAGGERCQNLHVAFCPPLAYEPTVIAHQLDGSPLIIKVAQAEVFGTRIELRRGAAVEPPERATICFEVQPL